MSDTSPDSKPTPRRSILSMIFPLLLAIATVVGIIIGSQLNAPVAGGFDISIFSPPQKADAGKVSQLINYIEDQYVDSINKEELIEETIQHVLQKLDPHSYYISAAELAEMQQPLEGSFDGIGIEFIVIDDTVVVVNALEGGPSAASGLQAGDRLLAVDGQEVAGIDIENSKVMDLLKGKSGSQVNLEIQRKGASEPLAYTITRGKIPINSVEVSYMVSDSVGYLKLVRFSKTTYDEFKRATDHMLAQGMTKLILDLRGNGGGYLDAATQLVDEFLPEGKLIVYTQGKSRDKDETYATANGSLEHVDLAVLVNQNSASASEIVAGAIQDNDRGMVVGRRSFGKGLVQEHRKLPDGSAVRLTIARYYTPTGRCIQKPYGDGVDYDEDLVNRSENGELLSLDSISLPDSLKFVTDGGNIVYGGGGIMPDLFVPIDTIGASFYLSELNYRGILNQFAFRYADSNREKLNAYNNPEAFDAAFEIEESLLEEMVVFAEGQRVPRDNDGLQASRSVITNRLKALIARNIWQNLGYYPIINTEDTVFNRAVGIL